MRLNAPARIVFLISVIIAVVALLPVLHIVATIPHPFWIMTAAYAVLAAGCLFKGM